MLSKSHSSMGEAIRNQLQILKKTQKKLAEELGINEAELSKWLNQQKTMQEDMIVRIAQLLQLPVEQMLLLAGEARCCMRVKEIRKKKPDLQKEQCYEEALKGYKKLFGLLGTKSIQEHTPKHSYISLEDFPHMVSGPWTVIVGDRRERPVKGRGDLIGISVASSDFMFLHKLRLDPETTVMRSDKTLLIASKNDLKELLTTNLLVIGSPAVSLGTRAILHEVGATFMFNIGDRAYTLEQELYKKISNYAPIEELKAFISDKEISGRLDDLLFTFRKNGFWDPIDYRNIRGLAISHSEDYGMIALAPNPWSESHIACVCAGVHGGGTAGAIQMLGDPNNFVHCPWGGIFKVSMSDQVPWEKRFENLAPRWETHDYIPDKYLSDMNRLIARIDDISNSRSKDEDSEAIRRIEIGRNVLDKIKDFASKKLNVH